MSSQQFLLEETALNLRSSHQNSAQAAKLQLLAKISITTAKIQIALLSSKKNSSILFLEMLLILQDLEIQLFSSSWNKICSTLLQTFIP
jgi:hypothetical protein